MTWEQLTGGVERLKIDEGWLYSVQRGSTYIVFVPCKHQVENKELKKAVIDDETLKNFNEFWTLYPRAGRVDKGKALTLFRKKVKDFPLFIKATKNYIKHLATKDFDWKKPKNAPTWINNYLGWEEYKIEEQKRSEPLTLEEHQHGSTVSRKGF